MDHERARRHSHGRLGRPHDPTTFEAKVDFGCFWVAVIWTDLAGFPAGDSHVAVGHPAKDLFDVPLRVELLLGVQAEGLHVSAR